MSENYFDAVAADWDNQSFRVKIVRAVGEAILRVAAPTRSMTVLDYGCGTGLIGLYLLPHVGRVTGADSSEGMLKMLRKKIAAGNLKSMRAIRLDLEHDPVPDDRFQLVVVSMAMHHIADVGKVLVAFHTLLLPGGILCIADLDTEPGTFHPASMAVPHHGFDREDLKVQLEEHGFMGMKNVTAATIAKPVEGGGEHEFSVFLITARRQQAGQGQDTHQ